MTPRPMLLRGGLSWPFRVGTQSMLLVAEIDAIRRLDRVVASRIVPTLFHRIDVPAPPYAGADIDHIIRALIRVTESTP